MIIQNTTICIDITIEQEWVLWMNTVFMPMMRETGYISQVRLFRVLTTDEEGGASYALQMECSSEENYESFAKKFQSRFDALHLNKYQNRFAAFSTLLREAKSVN